MNEQTYLESIVAPLLSHPEDLKIGHVVDDKGILLTISANQSDMGLIIGKGGATANSLRTILRQYGSLHEKHISVKITDPIGFEKPYKSQSDREMLA